MNIVKRELRANVKSIIIWSVALTLLIFVWMIEYESFADNPALNEFIDAMPQEMLSALGMQNLTLSSLNGFVGTIAFYMYLLMGIQAILLGGSIISKEETSKTTEFLFVKPISRQRIILGKMLSAIINLSILNIVTLLSIIISTLNYDKEENFYPFLLLLFISVFFIQMIFLSIGMFVSAASKHPKKAGNFSVGILIMTFLIATLINMVESMEFLIFTTPFKYFEASYILEEMSLEPIYVLLSFIIIVIGLSGTLVSYPKRDLSM